MLTKKQKEILDFINNFSKKKGYSPSIPEIAKNFDRSVGTIHEHLVNLQNSGHLDKEDNKHRSMETVGSVNIPIVGNITAGYPVEQFENPDGTISLPKNELRNAGDHYALRVEGDSMIEEGIFDGDIVIIKKQETAENGQTVVAIIDDGQATLKKLYFEKNNTFRLQPRNPKMKPLFRDELEIRGIVVKVISNFGPTPEEKQKDELFKTLDLFAGIGGIRIGFERTGFNTVFANDFDKKCKYTYDANFKRSKLVVEDMRKINIADLPEFDFLLGGFPCQAFSIAGYRQGFKDKKDRGNLFFDVARILEARKPAGFLLENVKNLKGHDGGNTFKIIENTLKDLGYHVKYKVMNTMEYGNLPQNRERIYIVGFKDKKYTDKFEFPEKIKLTKKITDLLDKNVSAKYYYNDKPLYKKLKNDVKDINRVYQWRRQYVRENKSGVCPTLTANMGTGGHNVPIIKDKKGIRKLTPRECARLQGFSNDFILPNIADSALYKQIGNSVSIPVIEAVAKQMMKAME